jgi:hypothetical protein
MKLTSIHKAEFLTSYEFKCRVRLQLLQNFNVTKLDQSERVHSTNDKTNNIVHNIVSQHSVARS